MHLTLAPSTLRILVSLEPSFPSSLLHLALCKGIPAERGGGAKGT